MWLVNTALRHPFTVWVGMLLVAVLGVVSYLSTPMDILPNLKVPVVVVFASYRGMPAPDMEQSVVSVLERALTRCDHLQHIESRSLLGIGIVKVYFKAEVDPDVASSQVISLVNGEMQNMPPGMLPPSILKYDASAIPVGNLVISSERRDDKYLLDLADHQLKDEISGIDGLASAPVFGGVFRQVQIYVHPRTLEAMKMAPYDVARMVNNQSLVLPTGEIRIGDQTYYVSSNSLVGEPKEFEKIPIWADGRKVVYLGDVAEVLDGTRWRTNTVLVDGKRAVYMPLLRQAGANAVRVVDKVQAFLPELHERGVVPEDVKVDVTFDQSKYVRDSLANLRFEGLCGAVLASLVVLLFLGSFRSTWIVALSIPLSLLAAFTGLYLTGHTLNIMTLGGLALVLGRVIDDSIVDVENTVRHLGMGKTPLQAARDSAVEIATPVLMATITTVVVFLPLIYMEGVGKYLFTPLAVSAALAMFASYFVSRTVSPLYCARVLQPHGEREGLPWRLFLVALILAGIGLATWLLAPRLALSLLGRRLPLSGRGLRAIYHVLIGVGLCGGVLVALAPLILFLHHFAARFDRLFDRITGAYERVLRGTLRWRWAVLLLLVAAVVPSVWGYRSIGQELFPEVDAGEFTIHMRATGGPRVEETERQVAEIEKIVRDVVPAEDREMILSNIGISSRWSAIYTANNGPHAAFIRVQLRGGAAGRRTTAAAYVEKLRPRLAERFPSNDFFFETEGMIHRILSAGAITPIEVQVYGRDPAVRRDIAQDLAARVAKLDVVRDTYLPQGMDLPQLRIDVDRTRAALLGLTQNDVIRNVITALMSSAQIAPNFWIDPASGNPYFIGVQYPEHIVEDVQTLENVPITSERSRQTASTRSAATPGARILKEVADIHRTQGPVEVYHQNVNRVSQLFVSAKGHDLAGTAAAVQQVLDQYTLKYALHRLPEERHALAADRVFQRNLEVYFKEGERDLRSKIQLKYGVDPDKLKLPKGVRLELHGEVSSMRDSFRGMALMLGMALLLVYLVMAAQFASWLDPFIMLVAAPLGFIGVVAALWLTNTSLNIQSLMGVLMLVGISVSNSVLLVEFANRQRASGLDTMTAAVNAARVRMRPILMTTLATIAGLLPMAIHFHPGDEMNLPLARAVIGGLAGSTLLTLFIVPILYVLVKPRGSAPATGEAIS